MASDLSRVTDFPNVNDISVTNREACSEQATSVIDEVTRIVPSLSPEHPIPCRLPPELLAAIFLDYMQQYEHLLTYTMSTVPPWVNVSYVCRYWRTVALNCANLWTQFFFVSSKWMDELLRRSKTAPLIIYLNLYCLKPTPWQICCLEKALGHMERIQDLWINCGCSKDVLSMIHARLTAAAPLLRSLHLTTYQDEEDQDGEDHFIICKDMLPGASLRKLHLELCDVNWSSPVFNGLTELSLTFVLNDPMECWDGLLLLLSQLPLLRQLCLNYVLPPALATFADWFINTQNTTKVSLCRLEKLTLGDPIPWVTALLARLEFPRSTIVQVECNCDNPEDISMFVPFVVDKFSSHLSLPQSTPSPQSMFRALIFRRSYQSGATWGVMCGTSNPAITNETQNVSLEEQEQDSHFALQIILNRINQEVSVGRIIPLLRALPLRHLNAVTLNSDIDGPFDDQNMWTEVFSDAPELRIIKVENSCANMLTHALQPRDGVIFAPALTDIGLKEIEISLQRKCRGEENHEHDTGCFQCLHDALASRMEAGSVLQRLFLHTCYGITASEKAELSEVVGRVESGITEGFWA